MKTGYLLINVGTPKDHSPQAVGHFLSEFLNDPEVIRMPALIRKILVNGIIVPQRRYKSAENYKKIWTTQGSPLLALSQNLIEQLNSTLPDSSKAYLGMRYGSPSIEQALSQMANEEVERVIVFPLYPQYARATTESSVLKVKQVLKKYPQPFQKIIFANSFYNSDFFIEPIVHMIENLNFNFDHMVFSYHGLPESHIYSETQCDKNHSCCSQSELQKRNCYRSQCLQTTLKLQKSLRLTSKNSSMTFQSRLGRGKWLEPSTQTELEKLATEGKKKILVVCPSFVTDCLETLEEIAIGGQQLFKAKGGEMLVTLPCLNNHPLWLKGLTNHLLQLQHHPS